MSIPNQKTLRADIVAKLKGITLLADDADGTAHVKGYFETNPRGISPFVCVDSAGQWPDLNNENATVPARFVIGAWVKRDDPAAAEDLLNDLAQAIAKELEAHYLAKFYEHPQSDFEEIAGEQYKFELHFVEITN